MGSDTISATVLDIRQATTRLGLVKSKGPKMEQVNIYEAKTQFSRYVEKAEAGEDIIIARGGKQVARLTSISPQRRPVCFGVLKGKVRVSDDFDAPLPEEVLAGFEGR